MFILDFDVFGRERNIRIDMVEMAILFIFRVLQNRIEEKNKNEIRKTFCVNSIF